MIKQKGLGRGLDALLGGDEPPKDALMKLPVNRIRPGKYQPRTKMDQEALAELAHTNSLLTIKILGPDLGLNLRPDSARDRD